MARKDAPAGLDAVADELYRLPPGRFTAARNTHAQAARKAGDRPLADRIAALRRPTASAWAANLLAREHHEETGALLALGEALRRAHRSLDGEQLRLLNRRQRELVRALSQQAGRLAADAGHPLTAQAVQEVEETLHAALADAGAGEAFAGGRLTKPLSATFDIAGSTATTPVREPARRPPGKEPAKRQAKKAAKAADDEERARRAAERRHRREEAAQAGRQARQAEREAQHREADAAAARADLDAAERRRADAQHRLDELLGQVEDAERALRAARDDQDRARNRHRDAGEAARDARRRAGEATAHAERLAGALGNGS
ncbi:hypothetical protein ACFZAU_20045 [Streptomyces sp. NPDC008238]